MPSDMQMELIMLDPYERVFLKCNPKGRCTTVFTAPDVHGIFKMRVMHRRLGLSVLQVGQPRYYELCNGVMGQVSVWII